MAHTPDKQTVRATACTVMMTRPFKICFYTKNIASRAVQRVRLGNRTSSYLLPPFFYHLPIAFSLSLSLSLFYFSSSNCCSLQHQSQRESLPVILPTVPFSPVLFSVSRYPSYRAISSHSTLHLASKSDHTMNLGESHSRKRQSSRLLFHVHLTFH